MAQSAPFFMADYKWNRSIYSSWYDMHRRCYDPRCKEYRYYGARGIEVSKRWQLYRNFWFDMQLTWAKSLTLERINNNSHYSKQNCKWISKQEQAKNTRNVENASRYTFNGVTRTIREWAEIMKIKRTTLDMRLRQYKWPIEKALGG